ncbi:MAG: rRNA maturation RNase YbeY [Clostridiaceae bacterium]|nr:rRNA maturation RNase YbeY [Clostridiaceae bacterium]
MKITIKIYNHQKSREISKDLQKLIEKAVKLCVKKEGFPYPCEASITLTDNESIKELNREHRGIDKATDVLSFPSIEYDNGEPQIQPGDMDPDSGQIFLGDIIISVEKAFEQAQSFAHSVDRELTFLAVHGILHLLGYDHETENEEKLMFSIQENILNEMGLFRE